MKEEQFTQILRAINDVREDVREFKSEMNKRWEENDRRWEENNKRWNENGNKLGKLYKKIDQVDEKVEKRYKDTLENFDAYENSIENMYQDNRKRILTIEKRLKVTNH